MLAFMCVADAASMDRLLKYQSAQGIGSVVLSRFAYIAPLPNSHVVLFWSWKFGFKGERGGVLNIEWIRVDRH